MYINLQLFIHVVHVHGEKYTVGLSWRELRDKDVIKFSLVLDQFCNITCIIEIIPVTEKNHLVKVHSGFYSISHWQYHKTLRHATLIVTKLVWKHIATGTKRKHNACKYTYLYITRCDACFFQDGVHVNGENQQKSLRTNRTFLCMFVLETKGTHPCWQSMSWSGNPYPKETPMEIHIDPYF
jgi:hypothetical protein